MPRFRVSGEVTISVSTVVEASNEEEAKDRAMESSLQTFCHQCSADADDEWTTSGEMDGDPTIVEVERA